MGIAEDNNIGVSDSSDLEWKIKEVREKVNELESAIYDLVEPFSASIDKKTMRMRSSMNLKRKDIRCKFFRYSNRPNYKNQSM